MTCDSSSASDTNNGDVDYHYTSHGVNNDGDDADDADDADDDDDDDAHAAMLLRFRCWLQWFSLDLEPAMQPWLLTVEQKHPDLVCLALFSGPSE